MILYIIVEYFHVNIFEIIELGISILQTTSDPAVVGEVHLLNLINDLLLFLSISLIFDISIHGLKI